MANKEDENKNKATPKKSTASNSTGKKSASSKSPAKKSTTSKSTTNKAIKAVQSKAKGTKSEKGVNAAVKSSGVIKSKKHRLLILLITLFVVAAIVVGCWIYDSKTLKVSDLMYDWFNGMFNKVEEPNKVAYSDGDLIIHFVDVGQGDSIIIQFPDKKVMIIDGGPRKAKDALFKYIDTLEIKKFDYLMLTHSDEDHCGSLTAVITKYYIDTIYMPDVSTSVITTTVYKNFVDAANAEKREDGSSAELIKSIAGMKIGDTQYTIDLITPDAADYSKVKKSNAESINSISPIMVLTFGDKKVMLTGDANFKTEETFFKNIAGHEADYNVDILKVGHHGSTTSTSSDFLEVVKPEIAIVQCGLNNKYKHPTTELLARLNNCTDTNGAATVYRTDLNGNIAIKLTTSGSATTISEIVLGKGEVSSSSVIWININLNEFPNLLSVLFLNIKRINF